jgi:NAD-dependent dihydropyrimidine dehydrogenase PreA subunit
MLIMNMEGEYRMKEDVYVRLREFLDAMPGGFPATESGVEIKILKKLYTPEEAELTMQLNVTPETVSDIAGRIGTDSAALAEKLEEMAQKGLIYRIRKGEEKYYQAFQFLVGIYEFQLKNLDPEFCGLFEEYLPHYAMSMAVFKTGQMRTIPIGSAVEMTSGVAPYNSVRELIRDKEVVAVAQCICKKEQGILGKACSYPQEVCLLFGDFARYYLDNGMARRIDLSETFRILDTAEESGLVLKPNNAQHIDALCCCCPCCCPGLKLPKMFDRPADIISSHYKSTIDPELCTACEGCMEKCPMDAVRLNGDFAEIIEGRCIGCGICIPACPAEAISLIAKPGMEPPPVDFMETLERLKAERGLNTDRINRVDD